MLLRGRHEIVTESAGDGVAAMNQTITVAAPAGSSGVLGRATWPPRHWNVALALLAAVTILVRARYFGDPFIDVDEQFYLLVGDRMLHGATPYVDIWDRKPVGLFLLFAGIRLAGGAGIVQYQVVAAGFVAATAVLIAVMARRIASPGAALVAALAYAPALAMSGGQGGQTPVFYNAPVAGAALILAGLVSRRPSAAEIRWRGAAAMLLVGIAMQLKYTALFEGLYFGVALVWLAWRAAPRRATIPLDMALWIGLGLAPTLAALGWYALHGQAHAFVYANFTSIGLRDDDASGSALDNLRVMALRLAPFTLAIILGEWLLRDHGAPWRRRTGGIAAHRFLAGWLLAACGGVAAFGGYYNHYALPMLPPLAILAAPSFAIAYRGAGAVLALILLGATYVPYLPDARALEHQRGDAAYARLIVAQIAPRLHGRCMYIYYGDPILYHLAHSCLPSRWPFPFHLNLAREAPALGVDPVAEAERIMAARPPVVIDRDTDDDDINYDVEAVVRDRLARDYRLAWSYTHPAGLESDTDRIWVPKGAE